MSRKSIILSFAFFLAVFGCGIAGEENPELNVEYDKSPIKPSEETPVVSHADMLEEVTPSVVSVYTARIVSGSGSQQVPPRMRDLFRQFGIPVPDEGEGQVPGGGGRERRQRVGVGSGVIVSADGYIITNHHVVRDRRGNSVDEIRVRLSDDEEYEAELVGSDEKTDVAVLRIEAEDELPALTVADSENLRSGDIVFAIGNPLEVGLTVTKGIVSATGRNSLGILGRGGYENFIQTDAAINLGNSGGALIDASGRLVGINTAIFSGTGGNIGIGFAIPTNMVMDVAGHLIESGEVPRGLLGLYPENLDKDLADAFGIESTRGALVNQVQEDSPAEEAGIRHGDIILEVDGTEIESAEQLRLVISRKAPGSEVEIKIHREGETLELPVELGSVGGSTASTGPGAGEGDLRGVRLRPLDDRLRERAEIPDGVEGVVVTEIVRTSPFAKSLREGMVLIEVNGQPVRTRADVEENLRDGVNRIYTWFRGAMRFIVIRI